MLVFGWLVKPGEVLRPFQAPEAGPVVRRRVSVQEMMKSTIRLGIGFLPLGTCAVHAEERTPRSTSALSVRGAAPSVVKGKDKVAAGELAASPARGSTTGNERAESNRTSLPLSAGAAIRWQ